MTSLELNENDWLPGIVFSFDRDLSEELLSDTITRLETMERKQREIEMSHTDERKLQKHRDRLLKQKKRQRDLLDNPKNAVDSDEEPPEDIDLGALDLGPEVDPRFSFVKESDRMHSEDLEYWTDRALRITSWPKDHILIRALSRGSIGIHSLEMKEAYRTLVETLFRTKHLRVVIASDSLSLGINMPARSAVFAGDSYFLTPLKYRQMSGRSGRRGYDNVGHVIFFGLPPKKIYHLISAELTQIRGNFPLTPTVALRMLSLYQDFKDKEKFTSTFLPLVHEPFFEQGLRNRGIYRGILLSKSFLEDAIQSTRATFRSLLEFLFHKGLINQRAEHDRWSGLVAALKRTEPANFVFGPILELSEKMLKNNPNIDKVVFAKKLLSVLAHFFLQVPLPYGTSQNKNDHLCLSKLPDGLDFIDQQNLSIMRCFSDIYRPRELSFFLPLSKISFANERVSAAKPGSIIDLLQDEAQTFKRRSPFVALSGHVDNFCNSRELIDTYHSEAILATTIPSIQLFDVRLNELPLNAYVVDFYEAAPTIITDYGNRIQSSKTFLKIMKENGFSSHGLWFILNEWRNFLSSLVKPHFERKEKKYAPSTEGILFDMLKEDASINPEMKPKILDSFEFLSVTFYRALSAYEEGLHLVKKSWQD